MRESGQVLRLDKELMLFPIFSTIACLLVMASFALPLVVSPTVRTPFSRPRPERHKQHAAIENPAQNPDAANRQDANLSS